MKAEKRMMRENELLAREERRKRQEAEDEVRRKKEEEQEQREREREEAERKAKEEKERREYEEYLKIKQSFQVQEDGYDANVDECDAQNKLIEFIESIRSRKIVLLEELAAEFKMKTQEVIDRIQSLLESGQLTGVIDDRGKFIYITEDELRAVAKFIRQRGRVSIVDLVENSNQLIKLWLNLPISRTLYLFFQTKTLPVNLFFVVLIFLSNFYFYFLYSIREQTQIKTCWIYDFTFF